MKTTKQSLLAAVTLGGLVIGSHLASAQSTPSGPPDGKRGFTVEQQLALMNERFTLTDVQKTKVKAILDDITAKRLVVWNDKKTPMTQRTEKLRALTQEQDKQLKEVLTADQLAKFQKAREEVRKTTSR